MTENPPSQTGSAPRMIIVAGPNGSGKSTVTKGLRSSGKFPSIYINADDIARSELTHISDLTKRNLEAAKLAEQRRNDALEKKHSFAFETVMSTPGKLALLQEAKSKGFQVDLLFVTMRDPEINISRVSNRVALGGHDVKPDTVRERYHRTMGLLPSAVDLADTVDVFDNSGDEPMHVATKRNNVLQLTNSAQTPAWVTDRLMKPYHDRVESRTQITETFQQITHGNPDGFSPVLKDAEISHGKTYAGPVVEMTKHHALQQNSANEYIIHDLAVCPPGNLKKGKVSTLCYQYEKGGKHVQPTHNADQKHDTVHGQRMKILQGLQGLQAHREAVKENLVYRKFSAEKIETLTTSKDALVEKNKNLLVTEQAKKLQKFEQTVMKPEFKQAPASLRSENTQIESSKETPSKDEGPSL